MKRLLSSILIFMVTAQVFVLPCMAAQTVSSTNITATIPEGFAVYTKDNLPSTPTELENLGRTYDEFKADFNNFGYVFFAHSTALKCDITLSEKTTKVSNTIKNLYSLKDQDKIENAGKLLLGDLWNTAFRIKQIEKDYALFFKVEMYSKNVSNIMYVSVIDSVTYTLCLSNSGGVPSENVLSAFEGIFNDLSYTIPEFDIKEQSTVNKGKKTLYAIIIVLCVLAVAVLTFSIVNDITKIRLKKQQSNSVKKYKKPLR